MAGWKLADKYQSLGGSYGEEIVSGLMFSHKPGFDLMQNCDLPPPLKVFAGPDKTILSPMNRVYNMTGKEDEDREIEMSNNNVENEKLELLRALRLSQTRAREAERKFAALSKERDALSNLLLEESLQLFAYKQWIKLMEFQISKLAKQNMQAPALAEDEDYHKASKSNTWIVAIALCGGIAGFGFAFVSL